MGSSDLHALVAIVLEDTDLAEPTDIAAEVARRKPRAVLRDAYETALVGYVRVVNNEHRRHNVIIRPSAKVAAIRSAWQRSLRDRVEFVGGWKLLGDCTYDDLMAAAKYRRQLADRNQAMATAYEALAHRLTAAGVATAGDLPEPVA